MVMLQPVTKPSDGCSSRPTYVYADPALGYTRAMRP